MFQPTVIFDNVHSFFAFDEEKPTLLRLLPGKKQHFR